MSRRGIGLAVFAVLLWIGACSEDNRRHASRGAGSQAASDLHVRTTSESRITLRWRDNSTTRSGSACSAGRRRKLRSDLARHHGRQPHVIRRSGSRAGKTYTYQVLAYSLLKTSAPSNAATVPAVENESPTTPRAITPPDGATDIDPASACPSSGRARTRTATRSSMSCASAPRCATWPSGLRHHRHELHAERPLPAQRALLLEVVARDPKGVSSPSPVWGFNTEVDGRWFRPASSSWAPTLRRSRFSLPASGQSGPDRLCLQHRPFEITNQQFADFLNQMLDRKQLRWSERIRIGHGCAGRLVWASPTAGPRFRPHVLGADSSSS